MIEGNKKKKQSNAEKTISLKPLKFDEAVSDLLKVKPEVTDINKETPIISYWLAIGTPTNWKFCFENKNIWGFSSYYQHSWALVREGDILFCHATQPIRGIVGYCIVKGKKIGQDAVFPQENSNNIQWPLRLFLTLQKIIPINDWANRSIKLDRKHTSFQKSLSKLPTPIATDLIDRLSKINVK